MLQRSWAAPWRRTPCIGRSCGPIDHVARTPSCMFYLTVMELSSLRRPLSRSSLEHALRLHHERLLVRDAPDHDAEDSLGGHIGAAVADLLIRGRITAREAETLEHVHEGVREP